MKQKLASQAGETLTEVLSCIVMIAMIFSFLAKAVEMSAKINRSASQGVASYQANGFLPLTEEEEEGAGSEPVILQVSIGEEDAPVEVQVYYNGEENTYYYYEYYNP